MATKLTMTAAELGSRVFALEAVMLAVASELVAQGSGGEASDRIVTSIKDHAEEILKEMFPDGTISPLAKDIQQFTSANVNDWMTIVKEESAKIVAGRS